MASDNYKLPPGGRPPVPGPKAEPPMPRMPSRRDMQEDPMGGSGSSGGVSYSVGKVGSSIPSAVAPGKSSGTGYGVRGKVRFKKGGSVSARADGIARKGKTKGKMV